MVLNILISTIDDGVIKVPSVLLKQRNNVSYLVCHQITKNEFKKYPQELVRKDVITHKIDGKGLTKSRNQALRMATGDICVIADDDVKYTNEYFDKIIHVYENNEVDIACFKIFTGENQPEYKSYPNNEKEIKNINSYVPSSIEITCKLDAIQRKDIYFDERFGLGSGLMGGEESLFIHDAIKKGLKVKFFPYFIVQHPFESTIKSFPKYSKSRVRVGGALDARFHGKIALLKAFAGTIKFLPDLLRHKKNPLAYLIERLSGALYILKTNKNQ